MTQQHDTHSKAIGYLLWIFGFTGSHRFYYGKPITGTIWFFTFGLFFIGWIIDLFLIPSMDREADRMETVHVLVRVDALQQQGGVQVGGQG